MTRLLIVEDEPSLRRNLERGLEEEGYEVALAASAGQARGALSQQPDLIVLDLMLPDGDGVDLLREFRSTQNWQPVLILTARDSVEDRVAGLDAGADDYLVKPFSFDELVARLRALRRRALEGQSVLSVGGLQVDRLRRTVSRNGHELYLSN